MYVVSLGWVHDSARSPSIGKVPGWMAGPTLCLRRRLWVKEYAMCVLYEIVRCGSQCGGSQSLSDSVPPRLGACARAGVQIAGAEAAAARPAAPPLRTS